MKTFLPAAAILAGILLISTLNFSCKKTDVSGLAPKEELVLGKWNVNRMQLKLYSGGGVFMKDTIIKQTPMPDNFVNLDPGGTFQYRFNTSIIEAGNYIFSGADSLIANTGKLYNWKILTLTKDIFTVSSTANSDAFYPGGIVETYQTFVRYK